MQPIIGQIALFAFNFAPVGWFPCDGRQLLISLYQPLFALLGTTYGAGSGTFALPDLRNAVPLGVGHAASGGGITSLGQTKPGISYHGTPHAGVLGLNYCICVAEPGIFPSRPEL